MSKKGKEKNTFEVNKGDELYVNVRAKIVEFGKDKSGMDVVRIAMDELVISGIVPEPVFFWAPLALIRQRVEENKRELAHLTEITTKEPMNVPKDLDILEGYTKKELADRKK